jgi:hypothetical protein
MGRRSHSLILCFSLAALAAAGCRDKPQPPVDSKEQWRSAGQSAPRAVEERQIVTEAEARAVLSLWLGAQNAGDFVAYEKLYATKFVGKKLAGNRATHFSRTGWLEDRKTMFEKPFTVKASDVKVALSPEGALIRFEQVWANDNFRDSGAKLLTLVREGAALVIAHEEMLSSEAAGASKARVPQFDELALVRRTVKGHALLIPGAVDINWATGHPHYISDNEAMRPVSVQALPPRYLELQSRNYEVFDREGRRCEAKPKDFALVLHVVPHFGLVNLWTDFPENKNSVPYSERALGLWRLSLAHGEISGAAPQGMSLALEFDKVGDCGVPHWGRVMKEGQESPWQVRSANTDETTQLAEAARNHPETVTRSRLHLGNSAAQEPGVSAWFIEIKNPRIFAGPGGETYAVAQVRGHPQECGFGENTVFVWRKLKGRFVPVPGAFNDGANVVAMIDVDGDGQPELIDEANVYGSAGNTYEQVIEPLELYLDCPC